MTKPSIPFNAPKIMLEGKALKKIKTAEGHIDMIK